MAAVRKLSDPPPWNEDVYINWKRDVDIWSFLTKTDKVKHGLQVYQVLPVWLKESVLANVTIETLKTEDGLKELISFLDQKFEKSPDELGYEAFESLMNFRRSTESMREYVNSFERLYDKAKGYNMTVSDGVLAIILLKSANLTAEQMNLCRATSDLKFDKMKEQLKKTFTDIKVEGNELSFQVTEAAAKFVEKEDSDFLSSSEDQYYVNKRSGSNKKRFQKQLKLNPKDRNTGETTRCNICESLYHWGNNCPDRFRMNSSFRTRNKSNSSSSSAMSPSNTNLTMFVEIQPTDLNFMVGESFSMGILDTGCVTTVCGKPWMTQYLNSLTRKEKDNILKEKEQKWFRFGDNDPVRSDFVHNIPAWISDQPVNIRTHVVQEDVPLLLSKESMKTVGTKIDLVNDTVIMLGVQQKLQITSTGHYCIPLGKSLCPENVHHVVNTLKSDLKAARKLHLQFGHPSVERLQKLVKHADKGQTQLLSAIQTITDECTVCQLYKRPSRRPVVTIPMASTFNNVVAIDLKEIKDAISTNKCWILHLVDHFTRFSAGRIIYSKEKENVVSQILECWIAVFGPPTYIMSDNGGEFDNSSFRDMCDKFNIEMLSTAAESPFSNGICERHHRVLYDSLRKIMVDNDEKSCSLKDALSWSLSAKNSMLNHNGYSPFQLVYGSSPNIPTTNNSKLPALETETESNVLAKHLSTLHKTREEYIKSEASDKLRKAMKHNIRPTQHKVLRLSDKVYYKRNKSDRWKGPGKIVGLDGKTILVKHGSQIVRVHETDINKVCDSEKQLDEVLPDTRNSYNNNDISTNSYVLLDSSSDESDMEEPSLTSTQPVMQNLLNIATENVPDATNPQTPNHFTENTETNVFEHADTAYLGNNLAENNSSFQFFYKFDDNDEFAEQKTTELDAWKDHNVYEEIVFDDQCELIQLRWVLTNKGRKKARLVVKGFQESHNVLETASPTSKKSSQRLMFSIVASMKWEINMLDISHAFLQGDKIDRDLYVIPPPEANVPHAMWKLKVCVYGLPDASKAWYDKVLCELNKSGVECSVYDPALFWIHHDGQLQGLFCVHVDDFVWAGSSWFKENVIEPLHKSFKIKSTLSHSFEYLGVNIQQSQDFSIVVDQLEYREKFSYIPLNKSDHALNEASQENYVQYQSLCGKLTWLANVTRPDLSFDASHLSSNLNDTANQDLKRMNKVLKAKVINNNRLLKIRYSDLGNPNEWGIRCYADAAHRNLHDGGSQAGSIIVMENNTTGEANLVHWFSRRLSRIVSSPLAAETLAMDEALNEAYGLNGILTLILSRSTNKRITAVTDCRSLYDHMQLKKPIRDNRLLLEINKLKQSQDRDEIKIEWVRTTLQLADALTKRDINIQPLLKELLCT